MVAHRKKSKKQNKKRKQFKATTYNSKENLVEFIEHLMNLKFDKKPPLTYKFISSFNTHCLTIALTKAIKLFFDTTHRIPQHNLAKDYIELYANYLFKTLQLCEKTHTLHKEVLGHKFCSDDGLQLFKVWVKQHLQATLIEHKYKISPGTTKQNLRDQYRQEKQKLTGGGEYSAQNIYEVELDPKKLAQDVYMSDILLLESAVKIAFANHPYSEGFRKNYYFPFCNARLKWQLERLKIGQVATINDIEIRMSVGSDNYRPPLDVEKLLGITNKKWVQSNNVDVYSPIKYIKNINQILT